MSLSLGLAIASSAGDIAGQELTRSLTGIAEIILSAAEDIHIHKPAATALAHRVKETINVIVDAQTESGHTIISPEWKAALDDFKSVLIDIHHALDEIRQQSYLAQIIHRTRIATGIEDLSQRLKDAFAVLKVTFEV
ncbi:hypothetical protein EXIGLDRAFT_769505 [Exidia glandulosa HHB12029]|uniref:Mixed lineage kinase domain-containing protein n=1 Tax=Exidia glandulosa HHB12029 TaxID=1314781 RepID=A0A165HG62_EXIGL|nr:hypothetical protein EXIGLDRAFT_769505 [Exidia glandulosa HHB12029]